MRRESSSPAMAKCSNARCLREAVDGFRNCPNCRKAVRKFRAKNCARGACQRGQAKLDGYNQCQRCRARQVHFNRRRSGGYNSAKYLYVATTTFGFKVGASVNPARRVRGLKWDVVPNTPPCNARLLKTYDLKGYLEPSSTTSWLHTA